MKKIIAFFCVAITGYSSSFAQDTGDTVKFSDGHKETFTIINADPYMARKRFLMIDLLNFKIVDVDAVQGPVGLHLTGQRFNDEFKKMNEWKLTVSPVDVRFFQSKNKNHKFLYASASFLSSYLFGHKTFKRNYPVFLGYGNSGGVAKRYNLNVPLNKLKFYGVRYGIQALQQSVLQDQPYRKTGDTTGVMINALRLPFLTLGISRSTAQSLNARGTFGEIKVYRINQVYLDVLGTGYMIPYGEKFGSTHTGIGSNYNSLSPGGDEKLSLAEAKPALKYWGLRFGYRHITSTQGRFAQTTTFEIASLPGAKAEGFYMMFGYGLIFKERNQVAK